MGCDGPIIKAVPKTDIQKPIGYIQPVLLSKWENRDSSGPANKEV